MEFKANNAEQESALLKEQLEDSQKQLNEVCSLYVFRTFSPRASYMEKKIQNCFFVSHQ